MTDNRKAAPSARPEKSSGARLGAGLGLLVGLLVCRGHFFQWPTATLLKLLFACLGGGWLCGYFWAQARRPTRPSVACAAQPRTAAERHGSENAPFDSGPPLGRSYSSPSFDLYSGDACGFGAAGDCAGDSGGGCSGD